MRSQKALTEYLVQTNVLKTKTIIDAFLKIDRADFMQVEDRAYAYADQAMGIGYEQTISQPTVVAFMLELLAPQKGQTILDIGSGSGWTTALLADCVGAEGGVLGMEIVPELVIFGQHNLQKYNPPQAQIIQTIPGTLGMPDRTFDSILVSAAASSFPEELYSQFTQRLVISVQHSILQVDKRPDGSLSTKEFQGFSFVPLI